MPNKRFSDVNPNHGDKDTAKPAGQPSGKTKPTSNPSGGTFKGPTHARGGAPSGKGGKDLASPKFEEKLHQEPTGELP